MPTPSDNRKRAPRDPGRSDAERARERALREQERMKQQALRQKKRRAFISRALWVFVMAAGAFLLFAIIFALCLSGDLHGASKHYSYTLSVDPDGSEGKQKPYAVTCVERDNTAYFSMAELADVFGYTLCGDVSVMSAVFPNGDTVAVCVDTPIVSLNGKNVSLGDSSYFYAGKTADVYVPVTLFEDRFDGLSLTSRKSGKKIAYTLSVEGEVSLAFSAKDGTLSLPDTSGMHLRAEPENKFIADLSAYEMYMDPEDTDAYITLINTSHPLASDYIPDDLTDVADTRRDRAKGQMRLYAEKALEAMFIEMRANGYTDVSVTSAYRSYAYQTELFNNSLNSFLAYYDRDTAYAMTAAEIAIPGTSEHQSGLCADLHNLPAASQAFEAQDVYKWLYKHCADFGFILRFPKSKSDITGIIFEPWHYRYVGRYHAQKIMQSGLCLEEYCEQNGLGQ